MERSQELWLEVRRLVEYIEKLRENLDQVRRRFAEAPQEYWELRRQMDVQAAQLVTVSRRYHSKVKSEWVAAMATDGREGVPGESPEEVSQESDPKSGKA